MPTKNNIYVVFAADTDITTDENELDFYAAANTYKLAEMIAHKDEMDGQILPGWSIRRMFLYTSEDEI